jgi:internalin A
VDVARHQGHPDSPVLILQNKCDVPGQEPPNPLRAEALKALHYRKLLDVSAKQRRGEAALHEALHDAVTWLLDPARLGIAQIGAGRMRVQRRLEAMRSADQARPPAQRQHRLIERSEFDRICVEEGGVYSPDQLLAYLDANGIIIHRPGLFNDQIVLDQAWALEAIYAVFDRSGPLTEIRRADGRFRRWHLANSIWSKYTKPEQALFLTMMRTCRICFLYRRFDDDDAEGEYIVPDLLPDRAAIAAKLPWDQGAAGEQAVYRYPLLHGGLLRAIMAEIGEIAGQDALYWNSGVWAYEATTKSRLMTEQDMTGPWQGQIRIATQHGRAAALLDNLVARFERIQTGLDMQPTAVERSSTATKQPEPSRQTLRRRKRPRQTHPARQA